MVRLDYFWIRRVTKAMIGEADKAKLQVGYKQALRALNDNKALKVFVAEDCDSNIKTSIEKAAHENDIQFFFVPTMKELGEMCEIEVGASCAVVLK